MEQRDYLKRQIDQLGKVLGEIITELLGLKSGNASIQGIEDVSQILKDEIDLDLELLLSIEVDELIDFLITDKGFNDENLDKLADVFFMISNDLASDSSLRSSFLKRCLIIYEYLEMTQQTYSLERCFKLANIKKSLIKCT